MVTFRPDQRAKVKNHARRLSFGGTECTREIVNGGSHPATSGLRRLQGSTEPRKVARRTRDVRRAAPADL